MESFYGWAGLLLGFSGLIFIHELGHFLLAKWNGVHVHVFSIGMGPYLISFTHKRTVYALSLIPIGGYVKLMGQDDLNADMAANKNPADFRNKRPGQKAAILAAGAAFNIATTLIIFSICYYAGYNVQSPCLGEISKDKPLAQATIIDNNKSNTPADIKKGDRILSVNGVRVKSYFDVMLQVTAQSSNAPVELYIERKERDHNGNAVRQHVLVNMEQDKRQGVPNIGLGADTIYKLEEPLPLGFSTELCLYVLKDPEKDTPAGRSGQLKKGDHILSLEDKESDPAHPVVMKMDSELALIRAAAESKGKPLVFHIERDGKPQEPFTIAAEASKDDGVYRFGIAQGAYHKVTDDIDENSDAYKAGLRKGDLVRGFDADSPTIHPWKSGTLYWVETIDDKKPSSAVLKVPETASSPLIFRQSYVVSEVFKAGGPNGGWGDAIGQSWDDTRHYTGCMFATLRNLITQRVNAKNLSGAVGIGHTIFDVASKQTFLEYLWWLAFISLNLGVMQLLPIPLLDGFHLVMVLVEKIKGSMVPAKVQEKFMYAGIAIIGFLLIFVTYNDIARFISSKF
ncbi:MAG TPA: site-2 protease family protein [Planctomycetota bacterium]|nr:site-2 protease family protein [Planctomycetota bacterium]